MKKKSKITDIATFIEDNNNMSPDKTIIDSDEKNQMNNHTQYNNLMDDQEIFNNLQVLFPHKYSDEIKYAIKCCDTFDAMINMLTSSDTVTLKPYLVKEDLTQREIYRNIDYDLIYTWEKGKITDSPLEATVYEHKLEQKEIENNRNLHTAELKYATKRNNISSVNSTNTAMYKEASTNNKFLNQSKRACHGGTAASAIKNTIHMGKPDYSNQSKFNSRIKFSSKKTVLSSKKWLSTELYASNRRIDAVISQPKDNIRNSLQYKFKYPEIFGKCPQTSTDLLELHGLLECPNPIEYLRKQAYTKSEEQKQVLSHIRNNNSINSYYSDRSASLLSARDSMNHLAVILILSKNKDTRNFIDLHGLHSREIDHVLTDWLNWRNGTCNYVHVLPRNQTSATSRNGKNITKHDMNSDTQNCKNFDLDQTVITPSINQHSSSKFVKRSRLIICTGTAQKAQNIRPKVLEFFRRKRCDITEEGANVIIEYFE